MSPEFRYETADMLLKPYDTGNPLNIEQFATCFPYVVRQILRLDTVPDVITCTPQSGEFHRFGVHFWAHPKVPDIDELKKNTNSLNLIIQTSDLMKETDINEEIKDKGIVVASSRYHKQLFTDISERARELKLYGGMDIEGYVTRNYMVLDYDAMRRDPYPIFSVPAALRIPKVVLL